MSTEEILKEVAAEVSTCTKCDLCKGATKAVPGEGNPHARIMFIGEGPGFQKDRQGRPFVGPAGQFLVGPVMKNGLPWDRFWIYCGVLGLIISVALLVLSQVSTPLFAQAWWSNVPPAALPRTADGKVDLSAPAPRLPDGKPDFSGVWNPPMGYIRDIAKDLKEPVPFQASVKALYDERAAGLHWKEEPDANCLPQGVPKVLLAPAPWRVVQTPERIFFVHEAFNLWWQVFMDGREFMASKDVTPTWHGYSTG